MEEGTYVPPEMAQPEEGAYVLPETTPEPKKNNKTLIIVIAVVVALIVLCCCCMVAAYFGLVASGPAVGNVFSNIVEGLEITPVP
jgi:flagellar basal body-associated protein FliL